MDTSAISAATSSTGLTTRTAANQMSDQDFFKLLVTELQNQDPFEPAKTSDMIAQVSQIRSIETSSQLMSTLQQMTTQQRTAGASELLGKYVEASVTQSDGTQTTISGLVTGVRFESDGTAMLELDNGQAVRALDVKRVTSASQAQTATAAAATAAATAAANAATTASTAKTTATAQPVNSTPASTGGWLDASIHL
jgi:flagellar basal-body rod modification protein FlgD